ncbi:MAG TPA: response regulator transcription factor [Dehalococcoidia bacterium]|jgi:DNA-binding NarL/FixJ family response regulator
MAAAPVRYMVVDDHTLFRNGLVSLLQQFDDVELVGEASSGAEAIAKAKEIKPQVVLMDIGMPGITGTDATRAILEQSPETAICILTVSEQDEDLFSAVRAGARGYLLKDTELNALHEAIKVLADGGTSITPALATRLLEEFARASPPPRAAGPGLEQLTAREREILEYVAAGWRNQEIADHLQIAVNTVKVHLRNILEKLDLRNRQQAAAFAAQEGLVGPAPAGRRGDGGETGEDDGPAPARR